MNPSTWLRPTLHIVSIGLFVVGIVITGSAAYGEMESTPYMVQIDHDESPTDESTIAYSSLTAPEKAVFDRLKTGQAAPVEDTELKTFANNAVRYQGEIYTFEMTYDPASLSLLTFGFGILLSVAGGAVFFLTQFVVGHEGPTPDVSV
ncbi:hypothetical protein SAMN05421858_1363 [Haladaptatus litoreus]|uniref:DUF7979 domain-containing protein n=1 Tax=Haladaptatus litoreus TaxID=553468 RepID=A0A1N6Y1K8_9EURY|nr:hypothetical protein [Haladaptatus litoreus]SIR08532.1 hypothetical protein SAMN05421858_1363 [Haladaptatus litoreus]